MDGFGEGEEGGVMPGFGVNVSAGTLLVSGEANGVGSKVDFGEGVRLGSGAMEGVACGFTSGIGVTVCVGAGFSVGFGGTVTATIPH